MNRNPAREQLTLRLKELATCCQSSNTFWPSRDLLESVEESVKRLIATVRKKPPSPAWKAFKLLDKRMPSLRIILRVDNLVKRAEERLKEVGESPLDKLAAQSRDDSRKLLTDLQRVRTNLSSAKAIDWAEHEKVLAEFSRTRTVELASNQIAPLGVRCYTRALELLLLDRYRYKPLQRKAAPLEAWLVRIKHPEAESLLAFHPQLAQVIDREQTALQERAMLQKREKGRNRTRRHRKFYSSKTVYPGDWIVHFHEKPFPAWAKRNPDAGCELCGLRVSLGDWWVAQRTDFDRARCANCQSVVWEADGWEVEWPGGIAVPRLNQGNRERFFREPNLKHDAALYAESIGEVLGDEYIPKRIKELLAGDQTDGPSIESR